MSHKTEIMTAAGTLACALGIGFVMQSGDAAQQRYGDHVQVAQNSVITVGLSSVERLSQGADPAADGPVLDVHDITLTSAELPEAVTRTATAEPAVFEEPAPLASGPQYTIRSGCPVSATAQPLPGAMVSVEVKAACFAGQIVTITHQSIVFDEKLSDDGKLSVVIPALKSDAEFSISFENGKSATASTSVPTIALYDRVLIQGVGETGIQIHAREFGASYGDDGHVWSGAPRDASAVNDGVGGFMTVLGQPGDKDHLVSEIYTYPVAVSRAVGAVDLSIETEVTAANCGMTVSATAVKVFRGGLPEVSDLSIDVPSCEAVGDFLVLKNPLGDLKLASN